MKKREYLEACLRQPVDWLRQSATNPSKTMTRSHVLIHYVAIRRKGGERGLPA